MGSARVALLVAVVIWGWTFVATKVCLEQLSVAELLGLRLLVALPVLGAIARGRGTPLFPRPVPRALVGGTLLITIHFLIQISGLRLTTATRTGWIIAITPVVTAVLSALVLRERVTRRLVCGIAVATCGILLLLSGGRPGGLAWSGAAGDWLILASAHTWALYTIAIRNITRTTAPLSVTIGVLAPPAALLGLYALSRFDAARIVGLRVETICALLFLGVFGTALAHWLWQVGVSRVGAARAGVFLYLEPLSTTALAVPYLGETFGPSTLAGGAMVLLGVWIAERPSGSGGQSSNSANRSSSVRIPSRSSAISSSSCRTRW
ncbi:MAG TPA: DMT family transporter [Candidatus Polarisedimenticolaceae bacterium]|nr:DMT family transporter [Candidatus Polarisedimenticolaceae bacterium]